MVLKLTDLPPSMVLKPSPDARACGVVVDVKTVTSPNSREFHYVRHRRVLKEREATRRALIGQSVPVLPVVVTLTRLSSATCDDDNLPTAAKAIRDEIAALYGCGDSPRDPIVWKYAQEKCKRGTFGVRVEIEAAPAADVARA